MRILTKEELYNEKFRLISEFKKGAVFIYPTDTIYGLGCNAQDKEAVEKIRKIKMRPSQPFSVIAPSKNWLRLNCLISKENESWLNKLPGPYTLITKLKNRACVAENVNLSMNTIGVRIPSHWFCDFIAMMNVPVITTSVNKSGKEFMINMETLDPAIKSKVDYIIYEGEKNGSPSTLVRLDKEEVIIKKR
ncbi:threonylcarbamoyl-AMP synthase [Candidatus Woesearchaeota archaeon]|nr:threonylcarbamoyl-AMP synthase [Candidatus Woesearchaeota archaeon]